MSGADHGTLSDRFWRRVSKGKPDECWNWQGYVCKSTGYGRVADEDGYTKTQTHRVSWRLHNGTIPDGMVIRHKCDNRECVNPNHLEVGTQRDNVKDMWDRGRAVPPPRWNAGTAISADERRRRNNVRMGRQRTRCKRGHELPDFEPGKRRLCYEPECKEARRYNALGGR